MTEEERREMIWNDDALWAYEQEKIIEQGYREVWAVIAAIIVLFVLVG